jgi:hypothetical protein
MFRRVFAANCGSMTHRTGKTAMAELNEVRGARSPDFVLARMVRGGPGHRQERLGWRIPGVWRRPAVPLRDAARYANFWLSTDHDREDFTTRWSSKVFAIMKNGRREAAPIG